MIIDWSQHWHKTAPVATAIPAATGADCRSLVFGVSIFNGEDLFFFLAINLKNYEKFKSLIAAVFSRKAPDLLATLMQPRWNGIGILKQY